MEYFVVLAVLGAAVLATAVLPGPLRRLPLSMPIIAVAVGAVLFSLPLGLDGPRPGDDDDIAERLTELVVIVSLTGAGLKLQRSVGWRSWMTTWRLLGITMPLTVAAIAVMGSVGLGLPLAAAVLLGAVLAPTDPVLASEVQLPGPGEGEDGEENSIRFALTSEAGLNDGLAFPFTNLAIAIAVGGNWFLGWVLDDVVVKLSIGLVSGLVLGRLIGWLTFGRRSRYAFARSGEGLVAFGITLTVYGVTEILHGYGFLAVFVAAVTAPAQMNGTSTAYTSSKPTAFRRSSSAPASGWPGRDAIRSATSSRSGRFGPRRSGPRCRITSPRRRARRCRVR
jgi:sodium/hydrogen antiporter